MGVGLRRRARARAAPVGPDVPHDPPADGHLPGRQLERVHDRARPPGDVLLPRADGDPRRLRGRDRRRPPRERTDLLMAAAPPFVSYATMSEALVPSAEWQYVYASLQ